MPNEKSKTEKIEDIAKRRGFFWQSSEIYGGLSGFYDYGHLGALLKKKFESLWRDFFLSLDDNYYEIEPCNIMPENVFVASGHLASFVDPLVKCKKCGFSERADQIIEQELQENFEGKTNEELAEIIKKHKIRCPKCRGELSEVGTLNMMFPLEIGQSGKAYLRPETAQGVYVNFRREFEQLRKRMPLGLAIIGKAYRNEISPRNLLIRMREFTQAELQIFFDPDMIETHEKFDEVADYPLRLYSLADRKTGRVDEISCREAVKRGMPQFYVYHLAKIQQFYLDVLKLPRELFRFRELSEEERAFYNRIHWDIELQLESLGGWKEVGGLHYRGDHDLSGHQRVSKQDMYIIMDGKKFVPHVLELSFGVDRNVYALLDIGYAEEKERTIFQLPRAVSPYDAGIFPLMSKDGMPDKARELQQSLKEHFTIFYDDSGSIGRRYRRMDEIGVSLSITVDHQTLDDSTVTVRERDSMKQIRIRIHDLVKIIKEFQAGAEFEQLGKVVK
ncbi:MAG: glycine--tRNA ligase [Candidatus Aenigmarchaeota archaeon]|nr:glycine--tRNA ligase [Candidatus Aenigmarchaeota archaeon]